MNKDIIIKQVGFVDTTQSERMNDNMKVEYCNETIKLFGQAQVAYLILAKRLYEINRYKLYQPQWQTFADFCIELNELSRSQVSRLIGIHEKFVMQAGIEREDLGDAGWTKLAMTLPHVRTTDEAKYWFEKAKTLTRNDLAREIKEKITGKQMSECKHEHKYMISICEDCGDKWSEYDIATINEIRLQEALDQFGIEVTYQQAKDILKVMAEKSYKQTI